MKKKFNKEKIISLRKGNNLTQQEFAKKLSVSQQLVSFWETGKRKPSIEHQELLAEFEREMRGKGKTKIKKPQVIPDIPVERKLDQLLDVLRYHPDNPHLHAQAANFFLKLGKPDEAFFHINEALRIQPDFTPFTMMLARCFLMKGEDNLAVPILEQLVSLRPYDSNIIARLAQALNGEKMSAKPSSFGETEKAKKLLQDAIKRELEKGYKNRFLASILCNLN